MILILQVKYNTSIKETIVYTVYEKVQYELFQCYNITININDFVILDSSGKDNGTYKTSFHITLKDKYFENQKRVKMFVDYHPDEMFKKCDGWLDKSIYETDHFLRLMNRSK